MEYSRDIVLIAYCRAYCHQSFCRCIGKLMREVAGLETGGCKRRYGSYAVGCPLGSSKLNKERSPLPSNRSFVVGRRQWVKAWDNHNSFRQPSDVFSYSAVRKRLLITAARKSDISQGMKGKPVGSYVSVE